LFLVALDVKTFAAESLGDSGYDAFLVAEVITLLGFITQCLTVVFSQVEIGCNNTAGDIVRVSGHRDGFEQDLRSGNCAPYVEQDTAVCEFGYFIRVDQEISAGAAAFCLAVK